jgi:hypothetical protein
MQQDGKGASTIKTVRGVLRPAFQMAVDDDLIVKKHLDSSLPLYPLPHRNENF